MNQIYSLLLIRKLTLFKTHETANDIIHFIRNK